MKRLIVALVAAVAVSAAFARLTDTQSFEESFSDFVPSIVDEDASELADYAGDAPAFPAPYNFDNFGSKYLSLDTGDATLWRTNAGEAAYFDMAMQFNPCASAPEIDDDTKIAVYLNSSSNLVVLAGDGAGGTATNVMTGTTLNPGTWARLTIASVADEFKVTLNTNTVVGTFASRKSGDTTIKSVGFKGTGALDDFVARTTDPFIANPAVQIGGEGYASIQDALTDAGASSVIELLANNADAVTLGSGESLKLKEGAFTYTGTITLPDGYVLGTPTTVEGVTTYAQVEGVAAVRDGNELPWVWYATFEEAYAAAAVTHYYPDLKVKVGSDFVLPNVSRTMNDFRTIQFIATTEDPIEISLANANYYMASTRYTFPANATLHIVSGSLDSISGGTLDVPAGVTVLVNGYSLLNNILGLTGTGTLKMRDYTYDDDKTDVYYLTGSYNNQFNKLLRNANWQGTLELSGINAWDDWSLADIGNSGSTIRFNGLTTYLSGQYSQAVGTIELVGDGLTINGAKSGYTLFSIPSALKGNGALAVTTSGSQTTARFEGDVSGFTGDVTATGTGRIAFGSDQAGSAPVIYVHTGASVTNAATATWTCANFVVLGELVANGTVSATNPLYGNATTGIYRANSTAAAITAAGTWQGTYVVGWNPSENGDTPFYINNYGSHANATIQIEGDENGVFKCYPRGSDTYAPNVTAKIVLNANWTTGNGFSGDANATTFASLSGSGDFTVAYNGTNPIVYNITKLDGYTGTLGGQNGKFVIGKVNVAAAPAAGTPYVATAKGTYGAFEGYPALTVAGADAGKLVWDNSGTEGYYKALVQSGDDYYLSIADALTADKTTVTLLADNAENFVLPASGSLQIVAGGFTYSGTPTTAEGYRVSYDETTGTYTSTEIAYVAQIGETKYETLKEAIDAATAGQTVAVIADCTVAEPITFNYGITVSNDYAVSVTAAYALRIFNGTASPVTFCGAGTYLCTGTGSPFLVGNNEETAKASGYGISGTYAGSMVLESGTLKIPGTSNNLVKVENGTFVMNGGEILGGSRGIKADADAGNFTSTVTINGGFISNIVTKTSVAASADTGTAIVTIRGGDIVGPITCGQKTGTATVTIPGTSTARFDDDRTTFCEAGYGTKQSGDWYVVAPLYAVKFISGEGSTTNDYSIFNGDAVTPPAAAEVVGKSFSAWNPAVVSPAAGNATYTALYTNNIYTITFVIGESSSSVQKEYGSEITSAPEIPVRAGYTGAWDDDPAGDTVTGDKTYTYTYSAETYTITFVNEIGADPASTNYTIESGAITLPTATTENLGVQFDGWTNATITTAITEFTPTTSNVGSFTLYAAWSSTGSSGFDGGDGNSFTIDPGTVSTVEAKTGHQMTDTVADTDMTYAQAYALGLVNESTGAVDELDATIEMKDGKVIVGLSSTPNASYVITLKVYEKASLTAAWPVEPTQTYTLGSTDATTGFTPSGSGSGFYKTEVTISNK